MATDIVIPEMGESVKSGVIASWLKGPGEHVNRDEPVLELETDKITLEVPAPAAGVLTPAAEVGQTVEVGAVVGTIDESAAPAASKQDGAPAQQAAAAAPEPARPAAAPKAAAPTATLPPQPAPPAPAAAPAAPAADVRATPLARKLAEERGVDLSRVSGTGAGGRIREQDVLAHLQARSNGAPATAAAPARPASPAQATAAPASGAQRGVRRERMTPLRQRIATRLVEAQHTAAMLTTFNEVDMSAVMAFRKQHKEDFEKRHGIGLGFMSFFVKAAVNALQSLPAVNSFLVQGAAGQVEIEYHDYCDVAVAVSTPKGLVVPVLRNCESLSFAQIESGIKDLATRARDGKLALDEMQGGTFTITNGGVFGSLLSTPILNPPQTAILGMHTIKNRAVEDPDRPGQVAIRPMMYLALSYDHRVIDGSEAVRFLVAIKNAIEQPERLLLGL